MRFRVLRSVAPMVLVSFAACSCSLTDPTIKEGYWHPRAVNEGNLAVMVADPHDLVQGRGVDYSDGTLAAAAVDRLYRDKVRALPDTQLGVNASSAASSGGGAAGDTTP